jgi:hypothetical protein
LLPERRDRANLLAVLLIQRDLTARNPDQAGDHSRGCQAYHNPAASHEIPIGDESISPFRIMFP